MHRNFIRFLSAQELRSWYFNGDFSCTQAGEKTAYNDLFRLSHNAQPHLPNHIHLEQLNRTIGKDFRLNAHDVGKALLKSLDELSQSTLYIERSGKIYAKHDAFEQWQEMLSFLAPLPFIAYKYFKEGLPLWHLGRSLVNSTLPLCPLNNCLNQSESTFHKQSFPLVDLHIHLNGSTEADFAWQYALENPKYIFEELEKSAKNLTIERFYYQNHFASPKEIYNHLRLGRWLQETIARRIHCYLSPYSNHAKGASKNSQQYRLSRNENPEDQKLDLLMLKIMLEGGGTTSILHQYHTRTSPLLSSYANRLETAQRACNHPLFLLGQLTKNKQEGVGEITCPLHKSVRYEAYLLHRAYLFLSLNDSFMPFLLHSYFLIQAKVIALLVHGKRQVGFEQFQHIADGGMRERLEKIEYTSRAKQLIGMYGPQLTHIEGRFAPKDSVSENFEILDKIHEAQTQYIANRPCTLSLVAHFIKKPKDASPYGFCRHHKLRISLQQQANVLLKTIQNMLLRARYSGKSYKDLPITGKDGASSEYNTPPEVFAPIFAYLKAMGLERTTYHVGEDFYHPLSGLRAIHEAIYYLNLEKGDRLGHCTALGIIPEEWRRNSGEELYMPRGEWLDNLLWLLHFLAKELTQKEKHTLIHAIDKHANVIYSTYPIALFSKELFQAWVMRKHNILYLRRPLVNQLLEAIKQKKHNKSIQNTFLSASLFEQKAMYTIAHHALHLPKAFAIFEVYHCSAVVRELYDTIIPVPSDFIPDALIEKAQKKLIRLVCRKDIVIEVMPTSNIRIAYYKKYKEHHMTRWSRSSGTKPKYVICSDDPGIFATTLHNELSHCMNALPEGIPKVSIARELCQQAQKSLFPANVELYDPQKDLKEPYINEEGR